MPHNKPDSPNNDSDGNTNLDRFQQRTYRDAWDAYRRAGLPFGDSDVAMLIWFTYQQHTRVN